jgi:hypothetical protein
LWWDIEYHDGNYFFIFAGSNDDLKGNVMGVVDLKRRCKAENKNRGERQKMIVHSVVLKPPYINI